MTPKKIHVLIMIGRIHNTHEDMGGYIQVIIACFNKEHSGFDIKTHVTKQELI